MTSKIKEENKEFWLIIVIAILFIGGLMAVMIFGFKVGFKEASGIRSLLGIN